MEGIPKELIVPCRPYGELVYVIKTYFEIKHIMEVTSGDYVKETHFIDNETHLIDNEDMFPIKETSLVDWDEAAFVNNIYPTYNTNDDVNTFIGSREDRVVNKQADDFTGDRLMFAERNRFLNATFLDDVKETDICDDVILRTDQQCIDDVTNELKETDLLEEEDEDNLSKQSWPNLSADTNSGKNVNESTVTFQDIDTDFFETDGELEDDDNENKRQTVNRKPSVQHHHHVKDKIEKDLKNEILDNPNSYNCIVHDDMKTSSDQSRTSVLSSTVLRATIHELEKALSENNLLLADRDTKLQQLRAANSDLKKSLNEEVSRRSNLENLVLQKDALLIEAKIKMEKMDKKMMELNDQLTKVRLHAATNLYHDDDDVVSNTGIYNGKQQYQEKPEVANSRRRSYDNKEITCRLQKQSRDRNEDVREHSRDINEHTGHNLKNKNLCCHSDDKISKNELHSNLKMRFMRDAFFYYMIGFHPDEQMNAILAILDYGDKRQDFVLEAHNMKKLGKQFCASKVSSRGLTFVQEKFQD